MTRPERPRRPDRTVLVLRHVPWEGPHRILRAFSGWDVHVVDALEPGTVLPPVDGVDAAVLMGGPMSVNDVDRHPGLAAEIRWIREARACDLPLLGVCLGSQLLARALGATVAPAPAPELGWGPVEVLVPDDPLLRALAPSRSVLHWHGETFDVPPGAVALARSGPTACQAFRAGEAWGLLFHAEADGTLVDRWLEEPAMLAEAQDVLGPDAADVLRAGAAEHADALLPASDALFRAFAARAASRD